MLLCPQGVRTGRKLLSGFKSLNVVGGQILLRSDTSLCVCFSMYLWKGTLTGNCMVSGF